MKKKVLVGMSGGVDSSVAVALLQEQGYDVLGVTLKLYDYADLKFEPPDGGCCTLELIDDARMVCDRLGVPHYVIDLQKAFARNVIDDFIDCYTQGRTPNPCINCNRFIKWGEMLRTADKLGCDFVATGHYARISHDNGGTQLLKGIDPDRDQSYALWGIPLDALQRTLLPIGHFTKPQIREKAHQCGFRNADRPDSQEICFVPAGNYAAIVRERRGDDMSLQAGPIFDIEGNKIGMHKGYAYYTIGQRRGFGVSTGRPLYVTRINPPERSITVGSKEDLLASSFVLNNMNLLVDPGEVPESVQIKIRYRHCGGSGMIKFDRSDEATATISFDEPERAITPGQSAVFYDRDRVLGGGIIDKVLD
jgi:tRNA-specific 2-thiouridylase